MVSATAREHHGGPELRLVEILDAAGRTIGANDVGADAERHDEERCGRQQARGPVAFLELPDRRSPPERPRFVVENLRIRRRQRRTWETVRARDRENLQPASDLLK